MFCKASRETHLAVLFRFFKCIDFFSDSGKELAQSHAANDGTVNVLHQLRLKYAKNLIIGHLNTNSIRNKFLDFKELVLSDTDICLISETKLDDSFPDQQFDVNGYKMFRKDRNKFGEVQFCLSKKTFPIKCSIRFVS